MMMMASLLNLLAGIRLLLHSWTGHLAPDHGRASTHAHHCPSLGPCRRASCKTCGTRCSGFRSSWPAAWRCTPPCGEGGCKALVMQ